MRIDYDSELQRVTAGTEQTGTAFLNVHLRTGRKGHGCSLWGLPHSPGSLGSAEVPAQ